MADLQFKLEYVKFDNADDGCFIHTRQDVPEYRTFLYREDYFVGNDDGKTPFMTGLMEINGVIGVATQCFRTYVEKSPVYTWTEVLGPVVEALRVALNLTNKVELADSGNTVPATSRRPLSYPLT